MPLICLPICGFFIGLIIIALGGGGGGFYVGVLTAIFNVPPAIAASTSLATIIPTTTIGMFSHWKAGNINFKIGTVMMISAIIGAIIGSLCSDFVPEKLYNKITGGLLLILVFQMLHGYIKQKHKNKENANTVNDTYRFLDFCKALFYGLLGGAMSGLVGISGTAPIVAGLIVLGCSALEIVGTSVYVLVGISTIGFLMHLGLGNVSWKLVLLLALGTSTGAFFAPFVLAKFSKEQLGKVLPPIIIAITAIMGFAVFIK